MVNVDIMLGQENASTMSSTLQLDPTYYLYGGCKCSPVGGGGGGAAGRGREGTLMGVQVFTGREGEGEGAGALI